MSVQTWFWYHLWIIKYKPDIIIRFNTGLQFIRGKLWGWRIVLVLRWPGLNERIAVAKKPRAMLPSALFLEYLSVEPWYWTLNGGNGTKKIFSIFILKLYTIFDTYSSLEKGSLKYFLSLILFRMSWNVWHDMIIAKHNAKRRQFAFIFSFNLTETHWKLNCSNNLCRRCLIFDLPILDFYRYHFINAFITYVTYNISYNIWNSFSHREIPQISTKHSSY